MSEPAYGSREEVERIRRVADQLSTAHAILRDRFKRRSTALDIIILLLSAWLTALAFIDPQFHPWVVPFGIDPQFWIGLIGVITFCLTLIQFKTNWSGRSEAHARSFGMYVEVKREGGYMLASADEIPIREFQRLAARYDMASDVGTGVPERDFLRLKQRHKIKVEISRLLDKKPAVNIWLIKFKLLIRDNWPWRRR
jgi:hypothetical protein